MPIIEPVIRPPSEAASVLLQVTLGCSSNSCDFCGAYTDKPFAVKPMSEIQADILAWAGKVPQARRVFLMDGDALVLSNDRLLPILDNLAAAFPRLTRIASYANGHHICGRTLDELQALAAKKLTLLYIGLESGSQRLLDRVHKKATADQMVQAVRAGSRAGIKSSVIVLLGLGGQDYSQTHVADTIAALNVMQPHYLSFLSLMLIPGTALYQAAEIGQFKPLSSIELLAEARRILEGLELQHTVFRANHASNYLNLEGTLPKDKSRLLREIDGALSGAKSLKPEWLRGL